MKNLVHATGIRISLQVRHFSHHPQTWRLAGRSGSGHWWTAVGQKPVTRGRISRDESLVVSGTKAERLGLYAVGVTCVVCCTGRLKPANNLRRSTVGVQRMTSLPMLKLTSLSVSMVANPTCLTISGMDTVELPLPEPTLTMANISQALGERLSTRDCQQP
jgi:hypothetical protein